ncbi:MAG: membrane protein insertase YidC [Flavobacteriales bacterium]
MDRNTLIGFGLIVAILIGWQIHTAPSAEERAAFQRQQDSLALVEQAREKAKLLADTAAPASPASTTADPLAGLASTLRADSSLTDSARAARLDSARIAGMAQRFGIFTASASGKEEVLTLENEKLQITLTTHGARPALIRLKEYTTYAKHPLLLADPDSGVFEYRFFLGNLDVSTKDLYFTAEQPDPGTVRMKAATGDPNKYLLITWRLDSLDWRVGLSAELVGLEKEVDPRNVMFHWDLTGRNNEKHLGNEQGKSTVFYKYLTEDANSLSTISAEEKKLEGRTNWVAFKQDFFTLAMIHPEGFRANGSEIAVRTLPVEGQHTKGYSAKLFFDQPPAANARLDIGLYMGPNHYNTLRRTGIPEFDRIIDLGWGIFGWVNRFIVIPIFNFLDGKMGYGLIILVLTIAIKILLLPIAYKNQKSSARMRALKPETDAINRKYPAPEDMMKRNQANMDLYRKAGVNPMSGCVPVLLQMPILFAMFRFFPASIELRQQPFLWADDLSSYDSIATLPFSIPFGYGDHVSLFTILMAASTIVYTLITSKQMPTQQGMPSMKLMMYLFPVMMLFFMNSLPAGLSYYYLLANLISILQMTVLGRFIIDEKKLRAELEQNMRTPKKKSKWQQRLEDIQKQQQAARRR